MKKTLMITVLITTPLFLNACQSGMSHDDMMNKETMMKDDMKKDPMMKQDDKMKKGMM